MAKYYLVKDKAGKVNRAKVKVVECKRKNNNVDTSINVGNETFVWLCDFSNYIKTSASGQALLFVVGTTCSGLPIEVFIPKSTIILKHDSVNRGVVHVYVPMNIAKDKGIGWHLSNDYDDNIVRRTAVLPEGYFWYSGLVKTGESQSSL